MMSSGQSDIRYTVDEYLRLAVSGVLHPDDRVELLEGVIVAMAPQNPRHASASTLAHEALRRVVGTRALVRVQLPLVLGIHSVPEPDVAVVSGTAADYFDAHPTTAMLVVEIADASLAQDRLTKARMYAAAGIPEYWVVNLRDACVEVFRRPDPAAHAYVDSRAARRGDRIELTALPGAVVEAGNLLPSSEH